jgi:adenine-specific DNA-methyltransferase
MLTCLGNKRLLVDNIYDIVDNLRKKLGKDKLAIMDGFSGSAVVSRKLSYISSKIYANDLEQYAYLIAKSSLETPCEKDRKCVEMHINQMNKLADCDTLPGGGFISRLYAPSDTEKIQKGERCFYTQENARIIHAMRNYIDDPETDVPRHLRMHLIVPLLAKASIHANTSGVFKGFHSNNGVGAWGGAGAKCLPRIKGKIQLDMPVWNVECEKQFTPIVSQGDINEVITGLQDNELDVLYLDPPYNQHPYGSNYFMLNLIADNISPDENTLSRVSGIPNTWNRSNYNYKKTAIGNMSALLENGIKKSTYILLSYNNEGIIADEEWDNILQPYQVEKIEIMYNAYRGSRNLAGRNDKVMERLYLITK